MTHVVWQEMAALLSSGALGSLVVWGYQNRLKK
jgi:hypothetical protein